MKYRANIINHCEHAHERDQPLPFGRQHRAALAVYYYCSVRLAQH